jgi:predicted ATP-grasp superfamily ATP-dependent carboligase
VLPRVPVALGLAREVSSKEGLYALCRTHGIPTADSVFPADRADVERYADEGRFPVVVKGRDAFDRRRQAIVRSSTVVAGADELRSLAADWPATPGVILQEYLPREHAEDWIVHLATGPDGDADVVFTGVKTRSWPAHAGITTCAFAVWNPELAGLAATAVRRFGFEGVADLDWRFDGRDGQYKLLDFNPRIGAQFRLFEDDAGIDVLRAQHLVLTGRDVPRGTFPHARRFVLEDLDLAARFAYRMSPSTSPHAPARASTTELGWFSVDNPLPAVPVVLRRASAVAGRLFGRPTRSST